MPLSMRRALPMLAPFMDFEHHRKPFFKMGDKRPQGQNRRYHGNTHLLRTVFATYANVELYEKYRPDLLVHSNGVALTDIEKDFLLPLAAYYHDMANLNDEEGHVTEMAQGNAFAHFMLARLGSIKKYYPEVPDGAIEDSIYRVAQGMAQKSDEDLIHNRRRGAYGAVAAILCNADSLEFLRVLNSDGEFRPNLLPWTHDFADIPEAMAQIARIQQNHRRYILYCGEGFEGDRAHQRYIEGSDNPLATMMKDAHHLTQQALLAEQLAQGKHSSVIPSMVDPKAWPHLTFLEFADRWALPPHTIHRLGNTMCPPITSFIAPMATPVEIHEPTQKVHYVYPLSPESMVATVESLQQPLAEQKLRGLHMIHHGIACGLPREVSLALLLDPDKVQREGPYYKAFPQGYLWRNGVVQDPADRSPNGLSPSPSLTQMTQTLFAIEQKCSGHREDPTRSYLGNSEIPAPFVFGKFQADAVRGVIVGEGSVAAKQALLLRHHMNVQRFYQYSPTEGLVPLSANGLFAQAKATHQPDRLYEGAVGRTAPQYRVGRIGLEQKIADIAEWLATQEAEVKLHGRGIASLKIEIHEYPEYGQVRGFRAEANTKVGLAFTIQPTEDGDILSLINTLLPSLGVLNRPEKPPCAVRFEGEKIVVPNVLHVDTLLENLQAFLDGTSAGRMESVRIKPAQFYSFRNFLHMVDKDRPRAIGCAKDLLFVRSVIQHAGQVVLTFLRDNSVGSLLLRHPHVREVMQRESVELQKLMLIDGTVAKLFPESPATVGEEGGAGALPLAKL